jgi:hypothetical protein
MFFNILENKNFYGKIGQFILAVLFMEPMLYFTLYQWSNSTLARYSIIAFGVIFALVAFYLAIKEVLVHVGNKKAYFTLAEERCRGYIRSAGRRTLKPSSNTDEKYKQLVAQCVRTLDAGFNLQEVNKFLKEEVNVLLDLKPSYRPYDPLNKESFCCKIELYKEGLLVHVTFLTI